MSETIARIGQDGMVELVDDKMKKIVGVSAMSPEDAAFLARSLLSCAAVLTVNQSPEVGALCDGAHFPVLMYTIRTMTETRQPLITFALPPGIDFDFQMTPEQAKIFGQDLVAHTAKLPAPQRPPDVMHCAYPRKGSHRASN
ncbi:MAG: hypothetical protein QOG17_934 [Gammaproteobacteria bacterium]|nr:hypothetical protein [Gammaproteobacteria bacterium]